jgi:hypothetical protein
LRNADLIATENGSSGWEGLLMQRRVVTISANFYDGAGLGTKVENPAKLGAAIVGALSKPAVPDAKAHARSLACAYDAELATTFPAEREQIEPAISLLAGMLESTIRPHQQHAAVRS